MVSYTFIELLFISKILLLGISNKSLAFSSLFVVDSILGIPF